MKRKFEILIPSLILAFASACGDDPEVDGQTDPSLGCGPVLTDNFTQVSRENVDSLDILFMIDTSGSQIPERDFIIEALDDFVGALLDDVDYRIAAGLAHGSASKHSGVLFASDEGEEAVLASDSMSLETIQSKLETKFENAERDNEAVTMDDSDRPIDYSGTDGGEAGLFATLELVGKAANVTTAQSLGFLRPEAALAVVFVSDENDICADYPSDVRRVEDFDLLSLFVEAVSSFVTQSQEEWAAEKYCSGVTPLATVEALRTLKGDKPLIVSGIINNDYNEFQIGPENDLGYGYLEAIDLANGASINTSASTDQISSELAALASETNFRFSVDTEFVLSNSNIAEASIEVTVDGETVVFDYDAALNEVQILGSQAGSGGSTIEVKYKAACE